MALHTLCKQRFEIVCYQGSYSRPTSPLIDGGGARMFLDLANCTRQRHFIAFTCLFTPDPLRLSALFPYFTCSFKQTFGAGKVEISDETNDATTMTSTRLQLCQLYY